MTRRGDGVLAGVKRLTAMVQGVDLALITPDTRLYGAMEIVSLAKLIGLCEEQYRVTVDDERVCRLKTVSDLARLIARLRADGTDDYVAPDDAVRTAWYYE